jgi:hypothetical protein
LLIVVAMALLFYAGRLNHDLLRQREELELTQADPLENTPPLVAFTTVALGGFRGLLADWLWLRSSRLQEEGKYFELVQLAEWITELQPRFAEVWAFHAWNLAYNVSVLFQEPEDRWRWVKNGISLLRDRGLAYNPGNAQMYRELGWMFQHKIGGAYDQAHRYYKHAWAEEMSLLFDGPSPDYDVYRRVADTRSELLKNAEIAELVDALRAREVDPFSPVLLDEEKRPEEIRELLTSESGKQLLAFLRAYRLRNHYKLLPEIMADIEEQYGPLDWRLPQAHSLYWAFRGKAHASEFDAVACERMIFQSMADALRRGQLVWERDEDIFMLTPNLPLLPWVKKAYEEAILEFPDQPSIKEAYTTFLQEALLITYTYHRGEQARELFSELQMRDPDAFGDKSFKDTVFELVTVQMSDLAYRNISGLLEGALVQAYFWQAMGFEDRAAGYHELAELIWTRYQQEHAHESVQERVGLPPLAEFKRNALESVRTTMTNRAGRLPAAAD